jgi:tRNA (adenine57-N1/adenine58-N1)-methyltransferase catalytic subunit
MKKMLIKRQKTLEVDGRVRVIADFEKHYVDPSKDFHMRQGVIRKEELSKKPGSTTKIGNSEFMILDADFIDDYKHIRRLPQIITLKDIGAIIVNAGITCESKIIEAGSGSGAVSCYLGKIAKKVVGYEIDDRNLSVAQENVKSLGLRNVTVKEGDIYDAKRILEKNFDALILDVPEPWKAIPTAKKVLRIGGFVVVYLPNLLQMQDFVKALTDDFLLERTIEVVEREWNVDERRSRPATKDHAHTGFLTFARKVKN